MNVWAKIAISILSWLGLVELIVGAFAQSFKYALAVLLIYGGIIGLVVLVILIFLMAFWIMEG